MIEIKGRPFVRLFESAPQDEEAALSRLRERPLLPKYRLGPGPLAANLVSDDLGTGA